jgi:hypothetical protein
MRIGGVLLRALPLLLAGHAYAGDFSEPCDWFQNATIGTRCAQTLSVTTGVNYDRYDYSASGSLFPFFIPSFKSVDEHYYTNAAVAVTPTNWLTLEFSSQYAFDDHRWTYSLIGGIGPYPLGSVSAKSSEAYVYRQTLVANVNLLDTGPGAQRFVLNTYLGGYFVPGHDSISTSSAVYGGLTGNNQWRLGESGLSLDALAGVQFDERSPNSNLIAYPTARLLLSSDRLGIAAGPVFESYQWLASGQVVSSQSAYYAAGGTVIIQPFRSSQSSFLNGITLQSTVEHSIGQANFIPSGEAKTDQLDVSGTVSFHFRY